MNRIAFALLIAYIAELKSHGGSLDRYNIEHIDQLTHPTESTHASASERDIKFMFDAMLDGRKIEAIKAYRTLTNTALKESKDAIEAFMSRIHRHPMTGNNGAPNAV